MEVVQGLAEPLLVDVIKNEHPESPTANPWDGTLPQPWVLTAGNASLGIPETITIKEEPCDLAYEIRYANGNEEDYVVQVADVTTESQGVPMMVSGASDFIEDSPIVLDNDDALGLRIVKTETLAGHAVSWEDEDISGLLEDSQSSAVDDRSPAAKKASPGKCPILRNLLTIPALQGIVVESDQEEILSENSSVVNSNRQTPERSKSQTPPAAVADVEKEKKKLTRKEVAAKLKNTIQGRQKEKSPVRSASGEHATAAPIERKTSSVSPRRRTSPRRPAEQNEPHDAAGGSQKLSKQGKVVGSKTSAKKGNESSSSPKVPEKIPEKLKTAASKDSQKDINAEDPKPENKAGKKTASNTLTESGTRRTRASARAQQRRGKSKMQKDPNILPEEPKSKSPSRSTGKGEIDTVAEIIESVSKGNISTASINKEPKKKKELLQQEKTSVANADPPAESSNIKEIATSVQGEFPKAKSRRSKRYALREQLTPSMKSSAGKALGQEQSRHMQVESQVTETPDSSLTDISKESAKPGKKKRKKKPDPSVDKSDTAITDMTMEKDNTTKHVAENSGEISDNSKLSKDTQERLTPETAPLSSKLPVTETQAAMGEDEVSPIVVDIQSEEAGNSLQPIQTTASKGNEDVVEVVAKSVTDKTWIPIMTGFRGRGRGKSRGGKSKTVRQLIEEGRTQSVNQTKEGGSTVQVSATMNGPTSVVDITGEDPVSGKGRYWTRRGPKATEGVPITNVATVARDTIITTTALNKPNMPLPVASINSQVVRHPGNRTNLVDKSLRGGETITVRPVTSANMTRPMVSILKVGSSNTEAGVPAGNVFVLDLTESGNQPDQIANVNKNSLSSQPRNILPAFPSGQTLVPVTVTLTRTATGSIVANHTTPNILSTAGKKLSPGQPMTRLSHVVPSVPGMVPPPRGQLIPKLPVPSTNEPTHMYKIHRDNSGTSVKIVQFPSQTESGNKETNSPASSGILNKQIAPTADSAGIIINTAPPDDDAVSVASSCQSGSDIEDFVCPICSLVFPDASSLGQHVVVHRTFKTKATYQCDRCGAKFGRKRDFESHSATHKEVTPRIGICRSPSPTDCLLVECLAEGQHEREISERLQSNKKDIIHVSEPNIPQDISQQEILQAPSVTTSAIESGACNANENMNVSEVNHDPGISGEGKPEDEVINLESNQFNTFEATLQDMDDIVFQVNEPDPFSDSVPLNIPFTPESSNIYPKVKYRFLCEACGRRFSRLCHLSSHVKVHASEEDYSCEYCSKAFTNLTSLRLHMKIHEHEELSSGEENVDIVMPGPGEENEKTTKKGAEENLSQKSGKHISETLPASTEPLLETPTTQAHVKTSNVKSTEGDADNINARNKPLNEGVDEGKSAKQGVGHPTKVNSPDARQLKVKTKAMLKQDSFSRDKSGIYSPGFERWESHNGPTDAQPIWPDSESSTVENMGSKSDVTHGQGDKSLGSDTATLVDHKNKGISSVASSSVPDKANLPNTDFLPTADNAAVPASVKLLPLQCSVCLQVFTRGCYLTNHRRVHSKGGPIVCSLCDNSFKTVSSLEAHKKVHHPKGVTDSSALNGVPVSESDQSACDINTGPGNSQFSADMTTSPDIRRNEPNLLVSETLDRSGDSNAAPTKTSITNTSADNKQQLTQSIAQSLESHGPVEKAPLENLTASGTLDANTFIGPESEKAAEDVSQMYKKKHPGWHRKHIKCQICFRTFPRRGHLTNHLRIHPPELVKKMLAEGYPDEGTGEGSGEEVAEDDKLNQTSFDDDSKQKAVQEGTNISQKGAEESQNVGLLPTNNSQVTVQDIDSVHNVGDTLPESVSDHEIQDNRDNVQCAICDRQFSQLRYLSIHMRSHFRKGQLNAKTRATKSGEVGDVPGKEVKGNPDKVTLVASEVLPPPSAAENEMLTKPDALDEAADLSSAAFISRLAHPPRRMGKLTCVRCGKKYSRLCHLMGHAKGHYNNGYYDCQICGKEFETRLNMFNHRKAHIVLTPEEVSSAVDLAVSQKLNDPTLDGEAEPMTTDEPHIHVTENRISADGKSLPFTCSTCSQSFDGLAALKDHMKDHTGNKSWVCSSCGAGFVKATDLTVHKKNSAECKGVPQDKCWTCGLLFSSFEELKNHLTTHQTPDRPHVCDICGAAFKKKPHLLDHVNRHTGARPYACPHCEETFASSTGMKNHMKKHADSKSVCNVCGAEFIYASGLSVHKRRMHPNEVSQQKTEEEIALQENSPNSSFEENMIHNTELDRSWSCKLCGADFTRKPHLRDHLKTHTPVTPVTPVRTYTCDVCEDSFSQMSELRIHKLTHSDKKMYVCNICGAAFPYGSTLYVHKKTHKDGKSNKCAYCSRTFRVMSHLKHHLEVLHGGALAIARGKQRQSPARGRKSREIEKEDQNPTEEPSLDNENPPLLSLEVLTEPATAEGDQGVLVPSAKSQQNLDTYDIDHLDDNSSDDVIPSLSPHDQEHIQEEEDEDDEGTQKLRCTLCRQIFWNEKALKVHMKDHDSPEQPFQCDVCQKSFSRIGELEEHKKGHKSDRPYQCQSCGAAFYNSSVLKAHISKHSGQKSYRCQQCGQTFSYLCGLWVHNRKAHSSHSVVQTPSKIAVVVESETGKSNVTSTSQNVQQSKKYETAAEVSRAKPPEHNESEEESVVSRHKNTFKCNECGKLYHRHDFFEKHLKKHAINVLQTSSAISEESQDVEKPSVAASAEATATMDVEAEDESAAKIPVEQVEKKKKYARTKRYECPDCSVVYLRRDHFAIHVKKHAKTKKTAGQAAAEIPMALEEKSSPRTAESAPDEVPSDPSVHDTEKDHDSNINESTPEQEDTEPVVNTEVSLDQDQTSIQPDQEQKQTESAVDSESAPLQSDKQDMPTPAVHQKETPCPEASESHLKRFTCPFCDAGYQRPDFFTRHVLKHKGEKKSTEQSGKDSSIGKGQGKRGRGKKSKAQSETELTANKTVVLPESELTSVQVADQKSSGATGEILETSHKPSQVSKISSEPITDQEPSEATSETQETSHEPSQASKISSEPVANQEPSEATGETQKTSHEPSQATEISSEPVVDQESSEATGETQETSHEPSQASEIRSEPHAETITDEPSVTAMEKAMETEENERISQSEMGGTSSNVPLAEDVFEDDDSDLQNRLENELDLLMAPPGRRVYNCPECPNQYQRKDHFSTHLQKQHLEQETNLSKKQLLTDILQRLGTAKKFDSAEDSQEKKVYICIACASKYHRKDHFAKHLKKHLETLKKENRLGEKSKIKKRNAKKMEGLVENSEPVTADIDNESDKVGFEDDLDEPDENEPIENEQVVESVNHAGLEATPAAEPASTATQEKHGKRNKSSEKQKAEKEKLYSCPECPAAYHRRDHFANHLKKHQAEVHKKHGLSAPNRFTKMIEELRNPARVVAQKFVCPHCSSEYQRRDHFETHLKRHLETDSKDSLKPRKPKSRGARKNVMVSDTNNPVDPVSHALEESPSFPSDIFANRRPEEEEAVRTIISLQMEAQQRNPLSESTYPGAPAFGNVSEPLDPRECESAVANLLAIQNAFVQPSSKSVSVMSTPNSNSSPQTLTPLEPVEPTISSYSLSGSGMVEIRPPGSMPSLIGPAGASEVPLEEPELMSTSDESSDEEESDLSEVPARTSAVEKESLSKTTEPSNNIVDKKRVPEVVKETTTVQNIPKSPEPEATEDAGTEDEGGLSSGSEDRLRIDEGPRTSQTEEKEDLKDKDTPGQEAGEEPTPVVPESDKTLPAKVSDANEIISESIDQSEEEISNTETKDNHQVKSVPAKPGPKTKSAPPSKSRKSYKCHICGSAYHRRDHFATHMSKHDASSKSSTKYQVPPVDDATLQKTSEKHNSDEVSPNDSVAITSKEVSSDKDVSTAGKIVSSTVGSLDEDQSESGDTVIEEQSALFQENTTDEPQGVQKEQTGTEQSVADKESETKPSKTAKNKDRKYTCSECGAEYFRIDHFGTHMKTKHPEVKWQEPLSSPKVYKCTECNAVYQRSDHYVHHMKSKHPGAEVEESVPAVKVQSHKTYKCTECEAEYQRKDHFVSHMKGKHPGVSYDVAPPKEIVPKLYICPECGAEYQRSDHFTTHMRTKHPETSQEGVSLKTSSGRTVRPRHQSESQKSAVSDVQDAAESHSEGIDESHDDSQDVYRCHECGAEYRRKYHFMNHMNKHRREHENRRGEKRASSTSEPPGSRKKLSMDTIEQLDEFVNRIVGVGHKERDEPELVPGRHTGENAEQEKSNQTDSMVKDNSKPDGPNSTQGDVATPDKYTNQLTSIETDTGDTSSPRYGDDQQSRKVKSVHKKIYRCPECCSEYQRKDYFDAHMKKHGGSLSKYGVGSPTQNSCHDPSEGLDIGSPISTVLSIDSDQQDCPAQDIEEDTVLSHSLDSHTGEAKSGENKEKGSKVALSAKTEKNTSSRKEYSCPDCDAVYHRKDHFATHMLKHERRKANKCNECGTEFESPKGLRIHLKVKHDQTKPEQDDIITEDIRKSKRKRTNQESSDMDIEDKESHRQPEQKGNVNDIKCTNCNVTFSSENELHEHRTGQVCEKDKTSKHHGSKPFECAECGAGFTSAAALRVHSNKHSKVRSFVCPLCGAAFKFYTGLFRHKKLHKSDAGFKCHKCHLDFTDEEKLKQHVNEEHPEQQKSLTCDTCGKYFRSEEKMRKHELEHQNEEPEESVEEETEGEEEGPNSRGTTNLQPTANLSMSQPTSMPLVDPRDPKMPGIDSNVNSQQYMSANFNPQETIMEEGLEEGNDQDAGDKFHNPSHVLKYRWNLAQFSRNMRAQSTGGVIQSTIEAARKTPGSGELDDLQSGHSPGGSSWTPSQTSEQDQGRIGGDMDNAELDRLRSGGYSDLPPNTGPVQRSLSEPLGPGPLLSQGPGEKTRHSTGNAPDTSSQGSGSGFHSVGPKDKDDSRPSSASQSSAKEDKSSSYPVVRPHPRVYKCEVCDIEIDDRQAFKTHMAVHVAAHTRTNLSPETGFREGSPAIEQHQTYPRCEQCGRQFSNEHELEDHLLTHRQESQAQRSSAYWGQHQMEQPAMEHPHSVGIPQSRSSLEHAYDHNLSKHMDHSAYGRPPLEPLPSPMEQSVMAHPQLEHHGMGRNRIDYPPMNYPPPYLSGFPQHSSTGYWEPVPMDYRDPSCMGYPERPPPDYHQATRGYPEPPMPSRSMASGLLSPGSMPPASMSSSIGPSNAMSPMSSGAMTMSQSNSLSSVQHSMTSGHANSMHLNPLSVGHMPQSSMPSTPLPSMSPRSMVRGPMHMTSNQDGQDRLRGNYSDVSAADLADEEDLNVDSDSEGEGPSTTCSPKRKRSRSTESDSQQFKCPKCDIVCKTKGELVKHKRVHTVRNFKCQTCGESFTSNHYLKIHMRWHSGTRPFQCEHCEAAFVTQAGLQVHMAKHSGERRYVCPECGAAFKYYSNLYAHKQKHA